MPKSNEYTHKFLKKVKNINKVNSKSIIKTKSISEEEWSEITKINTYVRVIELQWDSWEVASFKQLTELKKQNSILKKQQNITFTNINNISTMSKITVVCVSRSAKILAVAETRSHQTGFSVQRQQTYAINNKKTNKKKKYTINDKQ